MRRLPRAIRDSGKAGRYGFHGAVYLLRCKRTGIYKVGAAHNPYRRIRQLSSDMRRYGYDLEYVWSIASNRISAVERYWIRQWKKYRTDQRKEWVRLPDSEARRFMATSKVIYNEWPVVPEWIECVSGPLPQRKNRGCQVPIARHVSVPSSTCKRICRK
jgi:hypothetical protein